ncbi:pantoate--beta-alanine ligase [Puniceicoccaceae bacterium K14]|nr:pantoate--beta-alanine ligase [Puniceicoccaceae bacterium K14]
MKVYKSIEEWRSGRAEIPTTMSVGLVPTLGGLHDGHFALVSRSLEENEFTVVSIFLNRVQFNNPADLEKYPAIFEEDVAALENMGVDAIFAPEFDSMYPDDYAYRVSENRLASIMEGAKRPGHFDGVLTVVLKLFNIVTPTKAYFGEKDYQQLHLVKGMVDALFLPLEVVSCPTVREESGLALSSRNRRLSDAGLAKAAVFNKAMCEADSPEEAKAKLVQSGFDVEYVEDHDGRRLGAVNLEGIRLIDNVDIAIVSKY